MTATIFLLLNFALAFYLVGAIWAHEVDIFRNWQVLDPDNFHRLQMVHWKKLPYWVFIPLGLALIGSIVLIWYHPAGSPAWAIWGNLACQALSLVFTALFWGRWQAKLSQDTVGGKSLYLTKILKTHWVRTLLINLYGFIILIWVIQMIR